MANFQGIAAASESLARYLNHCFDQEQPVEGSETAAGLVRTEDLTDFRDSDAFSLPALTIYLYRVDYNKSMRAAWSSVAAQRGQAHLPLDLHFLLTPWADNATHELQILGRAMQCLEVTPILSGPLLTPSGGWTPHEGLQICLESISTEDVMRTFDSLPLDYKLSVCYLARIVRIDERVPRPDAPVTTAIAGARPQSSGE